jgi:hypothetical protein
VFAAAGAGAHGAQQLLAKPECTAGVVGDVDRVSASLTGASIFIALALIVTLITRPRTVGVGDPRRLGLRAVHAVVAEEGDVYAGSPQSKQASPPTAPGAFPPAPRRGRSLALHGA